MRIIIVTILVLFILSNLFSPEPECRYANASGSFTFSEMNFKDRDFKTCQNKFGLFKKENQTDTVLYRLCKRNFWQFWNYNRYLFSKKYKLPFASWYSIQSTRGAISDKTGYQDF